MLRYTEFKSTIASSDFPVLLFVGEEAFFREDAVKTLKAKYLSVEGMDFDLYDSDVDLKTVLACLSCPPFINTKRLALVKEYYPTEKQLQIGGLKAYLDAPQDFSVLAIVNEKPCDSLKKLDGVTVVDCNRESPSFLSAYAAKAFLRKGITAAARECALLVECCGGNMERLHQEIEKLSAYLGTGEVLTKDAIDALVHRDVELQIYELTAALSVKNADEANRLLDLLLRNNEKPQIIFAAIYNAFRRMLHIALSSKTDAQIAAELSVKEYAVKKSRQTAKLFAKKSLKKACDRLCALDYKMKSGQISADGLLQDCVQYLLSL